LKKLESFKQNLKVLPSSQTENKTDSEKTNDEDENDDEFQINEEEDLNEGNDMSWKTTVLKFAKQSKVKDPLARKEEDYTIIDPLKLKQVPSISPHQRKLQAQKKIG